MRRVILPVCALALAAANCPGAPSKLTDWGLPFHYAQAGWVTIHRDARNSDFAPYVSPTPNQVAWTALDGAATVTAPAQGPEGNLYVTTGQGPGTSHLHAFGRDGNLLWESAPHVGADDLDVGAIGSSPIIDRQGDIYLSDGNQFWAFHPDGSVKWVTDTEALGAGGTMVTAIFTLQGYVGGIPTNGKVMLFHRSDGSLAVPVFDLPGGDGPPSEPAPGGVWEGGYVDPIHIQTLWEGFLGAEREVANTPAVHPETGRIYITAAAATAGDGVLYGLDIVGGQIQIAFEGPMGGGSGTSPAISPDGTQVYAADGNGIMTAFDATTGAVLWQAAGAGAAASPAVGPDGTVYSGDNLGGLTTALVPADGSVKWSQNYDALADVYLDPVAPSGLIPTGLPVARPNSVISVSATKVWVFLILGYEFFNPISGATIPLPLISGVAAIDPADGSLLDFTIVRDTNEGLIALYPDGRVGVSHLALLSTIHWNTLNAFLPPELQLPSAPLAGITVLEPGSFQGQATAGLAWVKTLDAEALAELPGGDVAKARTSVRRGKVQLGATADTLDEAEAAGEISAAEAATARTHTEAAKEFLAVATSRLNVGNPSLERQDDAATLVGLAEAEIDAALAALP